MNTKITFYSGIYTIGGVVMEVIYGNDRIIMEIGTAYDPTTDVYDGTVLRRNKHWLKDSLRLGGAPKIEGLYAKADLLDYPLPSAEESPLNTAVFVTHLHLDHMSAMGMISPLVPVYLSKPAQTIEYALEDIGEGVVGHRRDYTAFHDQQIIKIGEIEVLPFLLNDRSYQDYSFYVKTPDLKIHYTGDLCLHSSYANKVLEEMEIIKKEDVDVLVVDTTSFMDNIMTMIYGEPDAEIKSTMELPAGIINQETVDCETEEIINNVVGLCVTNFYNREMADVEDFYKMAKSSERQFVLEPETAHIVRQFFNTNPLVYIPDNAKYSTLNAKWYQDVIKNCEIITKEDIAKNPSGYILQNSYENILELFDLPAKDAAYVHAGGIPIGDFDPAFKNLMRVLDLTGFKHVSFFSKNYFPHAYPSEVKYYSDQVNPKILIPSHGYNPERLIAPNGRSRLLPELGVTYQLSADGKSLEKV